MKISQKYCSLQTDPAVDEGDEEQAPDDDDAAKIADGSVGGNEKGNSDDHDADENHDGSEDGKHNVKEKGESDSEDSFGAEIRKYIF